MFCLVSILVVNLYIAQLKSSVATAISLSSSSQAPPHAAGLSASFDGEDDFIRIKYSCNPALQINPLYSREYTFSLWVSLNMQQDFKGTEHTLLGIDLVYPLTLKMERDATPRTIEMGDGCENFLDYQAYAVNQWHLRDWHHIVYRINSTVTTIRIDNEVQVLCRKDNAFSDSGTDLANLPCQIHVGAFETKLGSANAQMLKGQLDDIRIYNEFLNDSQIELLYEAPHLLSSPKPQLLHLTFDDTSVIQDHSELQGIVQLGNYLQSRTPNFQPSPTLV